MAKFIITPVRTITYEPIVIEADSEGDAYDKFREDDWITDDLTESDSKFDYEIEEEEAVSA